jgi:hypothetical protein
MTINPSHRLTPIPGSSQRTKRRHRGAEFEFQFRSSTFDRTATNIPESRMTVNQWADDVFSGEG